MFIDTQMVFPEPSVKPKIDIEEIVKYKLPSLPGTAMRLLGLLRDINSSSRQLTEAIGCDPSLTTRVLRLANSPIYALQKSVSSLSQAVEVVGTKYLYDIVIMNLTSVAFAEEIRTLALARTIWEHSLAVALLAREYSRILKMRGNEEVFMCGLLHDIGKIMLLRADLQAYLQITEINHEKTMLKEESKVFGYNHSQVGALVVRRWQLPENICHAILNHHDTAQAVESVLISHLVNVADTVANHYGFGLRSEDASALSNMQSAIVLRLSDEQLHEAWQNIQTDLTEIAKTFD